VRVPVVTEALAEQRIACYCMVRCLHPQRWYIQASVLPTLRKVREVRRPGLTGRWKPWRNAPASPGGAPPHRRVRAIRLDVSDARVGCPNSLGALPASGTDGPVTYFASLAS
jgi:hypothetical protein